MAIVQVTSREFRDKQASIFDLADKGENIIIRRGKKRAYTLTPIEENDLYFTPEMLAKIDKSLQEVKDGKVTKIKGEKELKTFLDNL